MIGYEKANVITDRAAIEEWRANGDHGDRCQVCFRPWSRAGWRGFEVHHIIGGANGRSDEPCNCLLVCGRCHDQMSNGGGQYRDEETKELLPTITLAHVVWVKMQTPSWDGERLQVLRHRRLPDPLEIPAYYIRERERWTRHTSL